MVERFGRAADIHFEFDILVDEVVKCAASIHPDMSDESKVRHGNEPGSSSISITHGNPRKGGQVFTTVFESAKSSWIKSVITVLSDKYRIDVVVTDTTARNS